MVFSTAGVAPTQPRHSVRRHTAPDSVTFLAAAVFFTAFAGQAWRNLIGWPGFVVVVVLFAAAAAITFLPRFHLRDVKNIPLPLVAFLVVCAASLSWSHYPDASFLGIGGQWLTAAVAMMMALTISREQLLDALSYALTTILALSFVFELFVTLVVTEPLLPLTMPPGEKPGAFYWSNNMLAAGGPIQGIVGNRNLLAFVALLAIIAVTVRFLEHRSHRATTLLMLGVSFATLVFTHSATAILATLAVAAVTGLVILVRRSGPRLKSWLYPGVATALLGLVAVAVIQSTTLLSLLGRDEAMADRVHIWKTVYTLALQEPVLGWGWVSYWAPWVEPFKDLVVIDNTPYFQAHNALADIWLQIGPIGVIIALTVALMAVVRAWRIAVAPADQSGCTQPYRAITLLPLLLLAALLIQSLTESRLLIEGNWLLFVICAVQVKMLAPPQGSSSRAVFTPHTS